MRHRHYIFVIVVLALAVAFFAGRATGPSASPANATVSGSHQATLDDVVAQLKLVSADDYQVAVNTKEICKAVAGSKADSLCK